MLYSFLGRSRILQLRSLFLIIFCIVFGNCLLPSNYLIGNILYIMPYTDI